MPKQKKVGVLLRVSTKMQASKKEKDVDIPTQRASCIQFIESHSDWKFEKEYMEVGVSGYKNALADRDKLLSVQADIYAGVIDVLLVFMFDRIGRIEEETPFVVKNFVEHGCEVWSVQEGQMKFESHIDGLLNYISFWQASGESKKTSQRVTAAMTHMAEEGQWTGGRPPFGYQTIPTGNLTKKGLPEKTLAICDEEANIVRLIYQLALTMDYGCHRIAQYLNEKRIPSRTGKQWRHSAVSNILTNPIYKGTRCYNRTTTKGDGGKTQRRRPENEWTYAPFHAELVIVPECDWDRVNDRRNQRYQDFVARAAQNAANTHRETVSNKLLFSGMIYCEACGAKLYTGYTPYKWTTRDGVVHRRSNPVYRCSTKSSGMLACTGQRSFKPETFEPMILRELCRYLDTLATTDLSEGICKFAAIDSAIEEQRYRELDKAIRKLRHRLAALQEQYLQAITGDSQTDGKLILSMMERVAEQIETKDRELHTVEKEHNSKPAEVGEMGSIPVWRELFDAVSFAEKRAVIRQVVDTVHIQSGCVRVKVKVPVQEFYRSVLEQGRKLPDGAKI